MNTSIALISESVQKLLLSDLVIWLDFIIHEPIASSSNLFMCVCVCVCAVILAHFYSVKSIHGGFTGGEIPYHMGSYWGIYIEGKMT